jgi:hypothetical protein
MKRMALIVGVNHYLNCESLFGCVADAQAVNDILSRDYNDDINFHCQLLKGTDDKNIVTRAELKDAITQLFQTDIEVALLYFAGHGHIEATGGYILPSDAFRGDEGVPLSEILTLASNSPARDKIIILDSCHSGIAGNSSNATNEVNLKEGITILTASTAEQYATEKDGRGLFTTLLVDALSGSAANLTGAITPGSVYAHIDQSLGPWQQRPVFKTNVKHFTSLRKAKPPISISDLHKLKTLFPEPGFNFLLNPTFEPELKGRDPDMPAPIKENTEIFSLLQKYNRLNLLVPVDAPHMWHAAMKSKSCKLTLLGEHYRRLVIDNCI